MPGSCRLEWAKWWMVTCQLKAHTRWQYQCLPQSLRHLRDIREANKMPTVLTWKWRSGSGKRKNELAPFDCKCMIQYWWLFFFRIVDSRQHCLHAKGHTCTHAHTQTYTAKDRGNNYRQNLQSRSDLSQNALFINTFDTGSNYSTATIITILSYFSTLNLPHQDPRR